MVTEMTYILSQMFLNLAEIFYGFLWRTVRKCRLRLLIHLVVVVSCFVFGRLGSRDKLICLHFFVALSVLPDDHRNYATNKTRTASLHISCTTLFY